MMPNNYPRSWQILTILAGCLSAVIACMALYVLTAIAKATKGFTLTFHVYLFCIILPDAILNLTTAVALFWEGIQDGFVPKPVCIARNGISFFYYYANLFLNAVVAREVYHLVLKSYQRQRSQPPTVKTVICQVLGVYTLSVGFTIWYLLDINASPFSITDYNRCDTILGSPPKYQDNGEAVFGPWTATIVGAGILGVPFIYVFVIAFDIWKRKLLPIRGKTRDVATYFFRIVLVFVAFYVPNISIAVAYNNLDPDEQYVQRYWVLWVFYMIVPFQCLVTLKLAMGHAGIQKAVKAQSSKVLVYLGSQHGLQSTSQLGELSPGGSGHTHRIAAPSDDDNDHDEWNAEDVYDDDQNATMPNASGAADQIAVERIEQSGSYEDEDKA